MDRDSEEGWKASTTPTVGKDIATKLFDAARSDVAIPQEPADSSFVSKGD
jgi:hypothetical protein